MLTRKITKNAEGYYQYTFELAPTYTPEGKKVRNRKTVQRKNKKALIAEVERLQLDRASHGELTTGGLNVEQWFTHWLEEAAKEIRPNTIVGYRSVIRNHIIPGLGPKTRIEKVTAAKLRDVYKKMADKGLSSTYMLNAHRVMSSSFADAVREGHLNINPVTRVKAPRKNVTELDVLTQEEAAELVTRLMRTDDADNEHFRWALALITGERRGECIGAEVSSVFTRGDNVFIDVSWQLQRLSHEHGCGGTCGRKRGGDCPQKWLRAPRDYLYRHLDKGLYWTQPKSNSGQRIIPVPGEFGKRLLQIAAETTNEWGLLFTMNGKPRDPDRDTAQWRQLCERLYPGRRVRLHDLRHTAVDLMYQAGVPEDIIKELVGHSAISMSRAYKSKGNFDRLHGGMDKVTNLVKPLAETERMREIGA